MTGKRGRPLAILIPENIPSDAATPGERRVHRFFREVFAAREDVLLWHRVRLLGREADFVLYVPGLGLFVVEVKDWKLDQIEEVGPQTFVVYRGGERAACPNPYAQARTCSYSVRDKLSRLPELTHQKGEFRGKPILPVSYLVVFPCISREELLSSPHHSRFDAEKERTLFKEDLDEAGPFLGRGEKGTEEFVRFLDKARPVRFLGPELSDRQMEVLRKNIFSDSLVTLSPPKEKRKTRRVGELVLDRHQEAVAREMGEGPRLLKGVAGSGKTLVLLHRAAYLARYHPAKERILYVCFNLSLARHASDMLDHNLPEDRRKRVKVRPFFGLCGEILGEEVFHSGRGRDYYQDLVGRVKERIPGIPEEEKYDTVLVDEGQDFSPDMFRVVAGVLRGEGKDLVVAVDPEQDIYGRFTLTDMGINFRGRVVNLSHSYRCTHEIFTYAHRVSGKTLKTVDSDTGGVRLFPDAFGRHGPEPEKFEISSEEGVVSFVLREVRERLRRGIPPAEVAVLYLSGLEERKGEGLESPGRRLVRRIAERFEDEGIPANWFSRSTEQKLSFDLHEETVKVGTVHSAKGLDFEVVFLLDPTDYSLRPGVIPRPMDGLEKRYRNLLFVGCTRAREELVVVKVGGSL
ncbi:MAG: hypothetical protein D6713_01185 [Deltaproteobacteria bacterium]|nr:MAG: hypothetical protein D6713_01185 [Deltaproteobacteria bacterium]